MSSCPVSQKRSPIHLQPLNCCVGTVRGPGTGEASGFGLGHRQEVVPAGDALLLKVDSDGFQVVVRQGPVLGNLGGQLHLPRFRGACSRK
jgi:hypothetical protein